MSDTTPNLGLFLLAESQASAEVVANQTFSLLDGLAQISILDRDLTAPPGSPSNGNCYLVATSPTGLWSGQAGKLALYVSGWQFITVRQGMLIWVQDEQVLIIRKASTYGVITVS